MAHRDDSGLGAGANHNASGTAALIELARAYGRPPGAPPQGSGPKHQLIFLSTDGGAFGGLGAERFVERLPGPEADRRSRQPRLDRRPRQAARRARRRPASLTGCGPGRDGCRPDRGADRLGPRPHERARPAHRPRLPVQLLRAGPLVGTGVPAITLTTGGDRPPASFGDAPERLEPQAADRHRPLGAGADRLDRRVRARLRQPELRLPRPAPRARLGDRARAGGDAASVRRRRGRPVRALPAAAHPGLPGPARLPQPARLLALGRPGVPVPRLRRRLAGRRRAAAQPGDARGHALAAPRRSCCSSCSPCPDGSLSHARLTPTPPGDRRGGARRPHRDDARPRRRRAPRRRDEPVRAPLPAPVPAHLALAPAPARTAADGPLGLVLAPAWSARSSCSGRSCSASGSASMRPGTLRNSSRSTTSRLWPSSWFLCLAGRGGAVDRDRARPVRAVPVGCRAAAARADPKHRSRDRARRPAPQAAAPADRQSRGSLRCAGLPGSPARVMIVAGVLAVAWVVVVWQWQDPFTAIYTKYEQHKLASSFAKRFAEYRPPAGLGRRRPRSPGSATTKDEERWVAAAATAYRRALHEGEPVGRLIVPRLGLKSIVVNGTSPRRPDKRPRPRAAHLHARRGRARLRRRPPDDLPGALRAHRQPEPGRPDHLRAPLRDVRLRGDRPPDRPRGRPRRPGSHHQELLVLQACHPRFFATHRYLAYAKLVRVEPRDGQPYSSAPPGSLA